MRRCWIIFLESFVLENNHASSIAASTQFSQVLKHLHPALFCLSLPLVAFLLLLIGILLQNPGLHGYKLAKLWYTTIQYDTQ